MHPSIRRTGATALSLLQHRYLDEDGAYDDEQQQAQGQQENYDMNGGKVEDEVQVDDTLDVSALVAIVLVISLVVLGYFLWQYYVHRTGRNMNENAKNVTAELIDSTDDVFEDEHSTPGSPPKSPKQQKTAWVKTQMELVKPRAHNNHNEYVNIGGANV